MIDPFEVKRKFIDEVRKYAKGGLAEELKKAPKGAVEIVISTSEKPHDEGAEGAQEEGAEGEHSEVKELAAVRENGHHMPCQCPDCKAEEAGMEMDEEAPALKALLSK